MKKKLLIFTLLAVCLLSFAACGKNKINLADYLIEERNNLFTANDELYTVTLSSGLRENNYKYDGEIGEMVDFAVLTLTRNNNEPLSNDNYTYIVTINENSLTGMLEKSPVDNSYAIDLETAIPNDAVVTVSINFTGYHFNQQLTNTSSEFAVDKNAALEIANTQLEEELNNFVANNKKFEVVMKILKDYSSEEIKRFYWYIGTVSSDGETLGILIDTSTGDVIAKKV